MVVILAITLISIVIGTLITFAIIDMNTAHGDDTEDPGTPTLNEQLLERAREWNIQKAINETLATAERFEK